MKLLCSSSNLGYLISLDIALQAEGIETFLSDADRMTAGLAGPMASAGRLYVLNEDDLEQAVRIAQALERAQGADTADAHSHSAADAEPDAGPHAGPAAQSDTQQPALAPASRGRSWSGWAVFAGIAMVVLVLAAALVQGG